VVKNSFRNKQITRNHRAKIRWGSEPKLVIKPTVTGEIQLRKPAQKHGRMGPVLSNALATLARPKVTRKEMT
jgi:hypothetical protein